MIHGESGIREAYRDDAVAREYLERRFVEPLGAMLHDRQVRYVRAVLDAQRPRTVLELAPGPARLTVDLATAFAGPVTIMDASAEMLAQARRRLAEVGPAARMVQGDAFRLPFAGAADMVYSFRLIRHFDAADRGRIYAEIARILRRGGILVFDAVNRAGAAGRTPRDPGAAQHYDALMSPDSLGAELGAAGFRLAHLEPVQRRFEVLYQIQTLAAPRSRRLAAAAMEAVDRIPGGEPLEWIVLAERI